jgi:hypothetical protein
MRSLFARALMVAVAGSALVAMTAASAGAAPTGAKNAFQFTATCNAQEVPIVVNNANGQGPQSPDKMQATFAPAHIVGTNQVFHPTQFDLTFSFTVGTETQSFTNTASRPNKAAPVSCSIDTTQTAPDGSSFSLEGTVAGWIS